MNVCFVVEGDPVGKSRPKFRRVNGYTQTYTPRKTREYEDWVKMAYMNATKNKVKLNGAISAEIHAVFRVPKSASKADKEKMLTGQIQYTKKIDADNLAKAVLDALNKFAYDDDKQVTRLLVTKKYGYRPMVVVRLEEIGDASQE